MQKISLMKRAMTFIMAFAILMVFNGTTALASSVSSAPENESAETEFGASITYNAQTGEVIYGMDQENGTMEVGNVINLEQNENSGISTQGIIGTDDRTLVSNPTGDPYRNICYVKTTWKDGTVTYGSGTLVYFNVMLTAGHLVYSHEHGGWANSMEIIPAKNGGSRPFGTAYATYMTSNVSFVNDATAYADWGIVDLSRSFQTWQHYGYYDYPSYLIGRTVTTIGYPTDHINYMYTDTKTVMDAGENYIRLANDTYPGDSGGAVIDVEKGWLTGIITRQHQDENGNFTYNEAVRINQDLFSRIQAHTAS